MEQVNLKIDGMNCRHCVAALTSALQNVEGVKVENVAVGLASLAYDPATTPFAKIREAVEGQGFQVTS